MDWDDGLDTQPKKKASKPMSMAIAGFLAALVVLLGLKMVLGGKDDAPAVIIHTEEEVAVLNVVEPEPEPEADVEVVAMVEPEPEPEPVPRRTRSSYTPPAKNYEAVTYYPAPEPQVFDEEPADDEAPERLRTDVSMYLGMAESGHLTRSHVHDLEGIGTDDDSYTQARALLLINAEQAKNPREVKKYLDQLFYLDENRYNPVFLSKRARWYANNRKYDRALADAQKAEQHWARIPPTLVFETKAEIFEVQAASLQGLFYKSEDDIELLDKAVRGWKKYHRHVDTRRDDLGNHAEAQIKKLDYARSRLR
jgi:hypothetical protein